MARKFLIIIAALILIAVTGHILWQHYAPKLMNLAFVPNDPFEISTIPSRPDYSRDESWAALPGKDSTAKQVPRGLDTLPPLDVDVFYLHPTTYLKNDNWNAAIDHEESARTLDISMLGGQASAFNVTGHIYAPRYRQATFGAFLAGDENAVQALGIAYQDVLAAFDAFIQRRGTDRPFILAGHSQGSLHGLNLLRDRIAGTALQPRMIAAYLIGWPISIEADLQAIGIPACQSETQSGCVISWQSFAKKGDPTQLKDAYGAIPGLMGAPRIDTKMLCTNPLSWRLDNKAVPASDNPGAVPFPDTQGALGAIHPALTGAQCGDDGILYIDPAPEKPFDRFLLPGENYHVYDYALFYMSLFNNARIRAQSFLSK